MKLNGSTDYAIKILLYLQKVDRVATAQEIAEGMNIPSKYIAAILKKLRDNGNIRSFQGSNGGFALADKTQDISLYDIIRLMEGELCCKRCAACTPSCLLYVEGEICPVSSAYKAMHTAITETARSITIRQISAHFSNQEYTVFYQPVFCGKTGEIAGADALARRISPDGAVILPEQFMPVLMRSGSIMRLDQFIVGEVSRFLRGRVEQGLSVLPISVNISQNDFSDPCFMEYLASQLKESPFPKGSVILELAESTFLLQEQQQPESYLDMLRKSGAQIMLDDFGGGYASVSLLSKCFFKRVKLDRRFVTRLCESPQLRVVVESIITMCHKLGIVAVAEGVETEAQLELLRQMDCDYMQGHYLSPPMDETSFTAYLRAHSCPSGSGQKMRRRLAPDALA